MKEIKLVDGHVSDALMFLQAIALSVDSSAQENHNQKLRRRLKKKIQMLNGQLASQDFYLNRKRKKEIESIINKGREFFYEKDSRIKEWKKIIDRVRKARSRRKNREQGEGRCSVDVSLAVRDQLQRIRDSNKLNSYNDAITILLKWHRHKFEGDWHIVKFES
ncbi:hypothetical protein [Neptunomonas japonica]|uniref:hypothetical protein n=1 Tax=Neptunomonas japonica TaxID=417574 RepID=UPI001F2AC0B2|nr:hypothetical protein [Neptunomonas japonica]